MKAVAVPLSRYATPAHAITCAAIWGALLGIALAAGAAGAGSEDTVDGVLHVKNGSVPSGGIETLRLEELWRTGGEDDEILLGTVMQVLGDADRNVYLLDSQLSEVQVFSADGTFLKTLSREGEGPGEVRRPLDMCFMPDGSLGMAQMFPGKIIKVGADGEPAGSLLLGSDDPAEGGFCGLVEAKCRAGNLVLAGVHISQGATGQQHTNYLSGYTEQGTERVRYGEAQRALDFNNLEINETEQYFVFPRRWNIGPQGRVYAALQRDAYAINVYARDGTLERVIEREFVAPERTAKRSRRMQSIYEAQLRAFPGEVPLEMADTEPAISTIDIAEDGMIWVLNCGGVRDQPAGIMQTYDLFDPQGHFVKQVAIHCDGDGIDDGLFLLGNGMAVLVTEISEALLGMLGGGGAAGEDEEAEPMEVICYRIGG